MKTFIKKSVALTLFFVLLISSGILSSAAVTADAVPGTVRLELNETEDEIILDVYILNLSAFSNADIKVTYDSECLIYLYGTHRLFDNSEGYDCHSLSYSYGSGMNLSAEIEFFETSDVHLMRYYFSRKTPVLTNGAEFTVEITTFFNETDSFTDKETISLPKEKVDPEIYPEALQSGDIDGDGSIDSNDARYALRIAVGLDKCTSLVKQYANVDGDYSVSSADARILLRTAVGLENKEELPFFLPKKASEDDYVSYYDLDITSVTLTEGAVKKIANVLIRKGASVSWSSSNPDCVTVSQDGTVTALKKGFSCIILDCGTEKFYYEVKVINEIQEKIYALKEKYPDGYYWNNHTPSADYPLVSETPCSDHAERKYQYCKGQCSGFAELLFSQVFPNSKRTKGVTWDTVKIGDYVRLQKHHSIFITDVIKADDIVGYNYYSGENITAGLDYVEVAHCNWYSCCNIQWDYTFTPEYEIDSTLSYTAY